MTRHRIEQAVVMILGFLLGATLGLLVLPGDFLSYLASGVVVSVLCREYFLSSCSGELLGWRGHGPRWPKIGARRKGEQ